MADLKIMRWPVTFVAVCTVGCGDTQTPAFTVTDSSGVRFVSQMGAGPRATWRLATPASLVLGSLDDSSTGFDRVRGAGRLDNGGVVVANHGTRELRYFGADGGFRRTVGQEGEGPGEFQSISWMTICNGDSVVVFDSQARRFSVFDADGVFVRSRTYERSLRGAGSCFGHNLLVANRRPEPPQEGVHRPPIALSLVRLDGDSAAELGEFPGPERYGIFTDGGGSVMPRPLGHLTVYALGPASWYVGIGDRYRIEEYSLTRELLSVIELAGLDLTLSASAIAQYVDAQVASIEDPNRRRRDRRFFEELTYPNTYAAYASMLVDGRGDLWVEDYRRSGDSESVWRVFRDGVQQASLSMPVNLTVYQISTSEVLGVMTDDLGVEYVHGFRIVR